MSKRENFPDQRKYNTFPAMSTTLSTKSGTPKKNEPGAAPSSLERASEILMCLGKGISSATEIAAYCDYSISTVHRLLQNLAELGWVIQDENSHKYFLGSLVHKLASDVMASHRYLVLHALKEMYRLADLTGETVILGCLDQLHFLKLHEIPSSFNLRIIEAEEKLKGQFMGATSRVLLSQLDDKELKNLLKHVKVGTMTSSGAADNVLLLEQIQEIKKKGYAVSYGERIKGAVSISAPVKNYFWPAALYVVGLEERLGARVEMIIKEVIASASWISEDITGAFSKQGGAKE
jgi:IclR family transcriptional regulator, KDG regulon repressor